MTRRKLSASDREELIRLFKETTETITGLANQFQVSISTARRVLKTEIAPDEYAAIVAYRNGDRSNNEVETPSDSEAFPEETKPPRPSTIAPPIRKPSRRSRRRSSADDEVDEPMMETAVSVEFSDSEDVENDSVQIEHPAEVFSADPEEDTDPLEVLPIETASLPHQCYLVVDRASELITPPLREFSELGQIPTAEESAKTLPIFANHKIASRFSRRSQRIIKIPNSDLLKKTYPLLNAKGVERILFDGQVFSLSPN